MTIEKVFELNITHKCFHTCNWQEKTDNDCNNCNNVKSQSQIDFEATLSEYDDYCPDPYSEEYIIKNMKRRWKGAFPKGGEDEFIRECFGERDKPIAGSWKTTIKSGDDKIRHRKDKGEK